MKSFLTKGERRRLGVMHKQSKKRREADKIKTILLIDSGYSYAEIQKILLLDDNTIGKYTLSSLGTFGKIHLKFSFKCCECNNGDIEWGNGESVNTTLRGSTALDGNLYSSNVHDTNTIRQDAQSGWQRLKRRAQNKCSQ